MNLEVVAFIGVVLWLGATVSMIVGLIGTRRPVGDSRAASGTGRAAPLGSGKRTGSC
jgi:hypothetical protein